MPQKIEISSKTIVFTVFFLLSLVLLWQIKDLIFSLFIAFIIAGALKPPVDYLEKKRLPRLLVSVLIYFLFLFIIFNLFSLVIPPLVQEMSYFFKNFPTIVRNIPQVSSYIDLNLITQNVPNLANDLVGFVKGVFSNAIFITSTLFFGFYLLIDKNFIEEILKNFFEDAEAKKISHMVSQGQKRAGTWFWGEVILMTAVGFLTYIGLTIIGMKYAVALAVLAGLLEIVPTLGPIISAIPAALIGFSHSYILGLSNIALYFVAQQLENNLIVPIVMKKIVGVHPVITLMALIIGGKLAGVLGVLLAVPTTIFIETLLIESQKLQKK
ncbi:MAG: hypothetical protein US40_C0003G0027 [Candidatus Roizmanbacteria bacterium GW2011_GWC2_37_13]|uniref:Permease n=1 Tax=Candidatus Roizmanbacteria bacterium GW2011_GWC2_37_13 TaxID=1618486 RepID=A0A0G0GJ84_9BACT|nr:MAG: hypothetical protein US38_C0004G0029 [Candidatus Roizmanbacteria bacterium GW2011_GWC1_37_12]KKQ26175.1 MAG: hypothetical protein US40_C0003G0027 [Candidatus Roizmanbacteria bacterium GW2011_GWC2_37_13]